MNRMPLTLTCGFLLNVTPLLQGAVVDVATVARAEIEGFGCRSELDIAVCSVYVQFDDPNDQLLAVQDVLLTTDDPAGFFQAPAALGGTNTAPSALFAALFPVVLCDSFVTVGLGTVALGAVDSTRLHPEFDAAAFNSSGTLSGGWWNSRPSGPAPQGLPDPDTRQVLIAQLAVRPGYQVVAGPLTLITTGKAPAVIESIICRTQACPSDLNTDAMVDGADLSHLVANWGPCDNCASCPSDLTGNFAVNAADLARVIGTWGQCQ